jgi:selenocysteine lyase/cysteine desulfurase
MPKMSSLELNSGEVRAHFPALAKYSEFIFGDNAGGSQILQDAVDRVTDYLINTNVQMGSDYMKLSTDRCMTDAQKDAAKLFNAASPDEIVFGSSSTQNLENLARGLDDDVQPDDEIIITGEHEGIEFPEETYSTY